VGGNKTDTNNDGLIGYFDTWLQTYSFSMPAPSQGVGASKTVSRDVHGIEVVVFTDAEGNTSKAARSGDEEGTKPKSTVNSLIKELGYVDIHIPVGCDGTVYFKGPNSSRYKIYNLITDLPVPGKENISVSTFLNAGMYRIEEISTQEYHKNENPITIISGNIIRLFNTSYNIGIEYYVNYYDYSLNEYDKAGRLIKSIQPLGFDDTLNLESSRNHELTSTFSYNSLGQLLSTTSPDEGTSNFKYREDGQIRFSQNSKQALVNEFSYTNYDEFGRPLESGVAQGNFHTLDGQNSSVTGNKEQHFTGNKEQHFTAYDYLSDDHKTIIENIIQKTYFQPCSPPHLCSTGKCRR
jgi:YD repeat-containing protein